jgi:hypothetical protein
MIKVLVLRQLGTVIENDCPCAGVASNGHLECLKYIHENGYPLPVKKLLVIVQERNQSHIIKYLEQLGW